MELERFDEVVGGKIEGDSENTEDKPPEYCQYRDEGCDLADSCLNCPFPKCIYDEHGGKQRWLKRLRAREMTRLFATDGKGIKELALMFGVSQRTVQRALKNEIPLNPPSTSSFGFAQDKSGQAPFPKGETGMGHLEKVETERGEKNE